MQEDVYNKIYQGDDFINISLPDYKITDSKIIKGKNILVVGVGTARDTKYLVKDNKVWGLDISSKAVNVAKKLGIKAMVFDINKKLPYKNSFFDIVIAKDIFEHLENPLSLLKEIRRVLKPNGYVVISVPNHFFLPFRIRMLFGKNIIWKTLGHNHTNIFEEWNYMHTRFFTWSGFKKFLKIGGFRVVKMFWDFGTLAHYSQPETVITYLEQTNVNYFKIKMLKFVWKVFNLIIPRYLRYEIVNLSPGLFCSGFYVWVKPEKLLQ